VTLPQTILPGSQDVKVDEVDTRTSITQAVDTHRYP
jgi:hypothetical protein